MKNLKIAINKESHQMCINHSGMRQLNAWFIINHYDDKTFDTVLIIEHNNFRVSDLEAICIKLNKEFITIINKDSISCTKIYGLPYNGLGGSIRDAFQIVWDYYLCF